MYESFYKLSAKPFALSPDPRFFFGSRTHKRAMSYLRYGLTQGEGFIVITGDVGAGKTILVRTLFAGLAKENIIAAQLVTTHLDADEMLKLVAASFGLAHEGLSKASLLKNLETFLITRTREGKRVLLVIDEAQNLPRRAIEELRMLSNYELAGKILLQSFLLGQAEFRDHLQGPEMEQLRQRVIAAYHLTPLDVEETKGYIEHRLRLVNWERNPDFTAAAYDAVHQYSRGIPRRINQICDRLLLYGYLEELRKFDQKDVVTVADELEEEVAHLEPRPAAAKTREAASRQSPPVQSRGQSGDNTEDGVDEADVEAGSSGDVSAESGTGARKTKGTRKRKDQELTAQRTPAAEDSGLVTDKVDDIARRLEVVERRLVVVDEAMRVQQDRLRIRSELEEQLTALEARTNALESALQRQQDRLRSALLAEEPS